MVAEMGWFEGCFWRWGITWERQLMGSEVEEFDRLTDIILTVHPKRDTRDVVTWQNSSNFTVKSLVTKAMNEKYGQATVDSLVCSVWKKLAPPKVEIMMWITLLGKLNTREQLVRKNMLQDDLNICPFCNQYNESINHVLLNCSFVWNIWTLIAADLGQMVSREDHLRNFYDKWMKRRIQGGLLKKFWMVTCFAVVWTIWMHRNSVIFDEKEVSIGEVTYLIRWRVALWAHQWGEDIPYSVETLVQNFSCIPQLF